MAAERRSAQQPQTLSITISPSTGEVPGRAEGTSGGGERSEALQRRDGFTWMAATSPPFVFSPRLRERDGICGGPGRTAAVQDGAHPPSTRWCTSLTLTAAPSVKKKKKAIAPFPKLRLTLTISSRHACGLRARER